MKKYRLVTVFLIAIMATAILALTPPLTSLTSADPWSPGRGPPIVIEDTGFEAYAPVERAFMGGYGATNGSISEWEPIKPLNNETYRTSFYDVAGNDTEPWSTNGTTTDARLNNWIVTSYLHEGWALGTFGSLVPLDMCRDLKALYMWFDPSDMIYIRLDTAFLFPGFGEGAMNVSKYSIYFSTNLSFPSFNLTTGLVPTNPIGRAAGAYDGLILNGTCAWEYLLTFGDTYAYIANALGNQVANDTWGAAGTGNNVIHVAVDYAHAAIEVAFPRSAISGIPLKTVCIFVASYKPGVYANGSYTPGLDPYTGNEAVDPHPFDPQAVNNGICPFAAGEELAQALARGPDHADMMAPATLGGEHPLVSGWFLVESQKYVEMSAGAKLHIYDASDPYQENITDKYIKGQQFTVNLDIVDAVNVSLVSASIIWDPAVLDCISWDWQFGGGTFLGASGDWIGDPGAIAADRIMPAGSYARKPAAGIGPSGSGTLIKATFNVTAVYGESWICWLAEECAIEHNVTLAVGMGKVYVEYPMKNAWFKKSAPSPGPGEVKIKSQTPPPHYPGEEIQIDLCSSEPGFNGTDYIPILNYSLHVEYSNGTVLEDYLGPSHLVNFTPPVPDTYEITVDIHLDPTYDPAYSSAHPTWLVDEKTVYKTVIEKAFTGIDCYTETRRLCGFYTDHIGEGWNQTADAYALDEEVTIYSYVFYNNWPKQSFLVSYEVYDPNGTLVLVRTAMTNASGIANMSFRILTVCMNPTYAFGKWMIFQKVYMCEEPYNDTLWFDVGWIIELQTVVPMEDIYYYGEHMSFTVSGKSISNIPRDVVISVVVYDADGVPIDVTNVYETIDPGEFCNPEPFELLIDCLEIPKWFYPGLSTVYVNAWFRDLPLLCGHPCCPEISEVFILSAPLE